MRRRALTVFLVVLTLIPASVAAQNAEWPGLYFQRCGRCHGDARALLDDRAEMRDGKLVGRRSGRYLGDFLGTHFGRRDQSEIDTIYRELLRVAQGGGRFRQQCAICHISGEQLARETLILRNGELWGRYSNRRISDFLMNHGRLATGEDVAFFLAVLQRNMPARP